MKFLSFATLALLLSSSVFGQSSSSSKQAVAPQIVEVPGGSLHLKGYLLKPAGHGPFPAVLFHHGSGAEDAQHTAGRTMAQAAPILHRSFSNTVTPSFMFAVRARVFQQTRVHLLQDLLKQAEARGPDARKQAHYQLITGSQLDDALAGLTFLKAAPDVDPKRIAIVGHSFGGMVTLLSGDHDGAIRAEVAFAAAANSWGVSQELRAGTLPAVTKTDAPIMLVYAANAYDTIPGKDISAELDRLHKSHLFKIYPAIGKTSADGHNLLYLGMSEWEPDVLEFLDANVKR